jgi:hypothetical protein
MAKDEIKQIMINDHLVGIVGLEDIIKKSLKHIEARTTKTLKIFCSVKLLSIITCLAQHKTLTGTRFYANLRLHKVYSLLRNPATD